jgi:hypothetical protein
MRDGAAFHIDDVLGQAELASDNDGNLSNWWMTDMWSSSSLAHIIGRTGQQARSTNGWGCLSTQ